MENKELKTILQQIFHIDFDFEIMPISDKIEQQIISIPCMYGDKNVTSIQVTNPHSIKMINNQLLLELGHAVAPFVVFEGTPSFDNVHYIQILYWLKQLKDWKPEIIDWIGIYFKESYIYQNASNDLMLGPYLGQPTSHVRISIDRGFCGLALREERSVNIANVLNDPTHIACSLSTRSELVIPIKSAKGEFVAELDVDSNQVAAFTPEIERKINDFLKNFPPL